MREILVLYEQFKRKAQILGDLKSDETLSIIIKIFELCTAFLDRLERTALKSKVADKDYFSFVKASKISRAINESLYMLGIENVPKFFSCIRNNKYGDISSEQITAACYVIAINFCAAIDIEKDRNQKTPGTFFEYLIGHLYARRIQMNPTTKLSVLNLDMEGTLPTDFVFDLGKNEMKFHVPVKLSTRERVIQVWAHQKLLDGIYGTGRFLGMFTCLAETKTDKNKREVVEICLPFQWRLYQMFIAQLTRIYYLDMPKIYERLNDEFPKIRVAKFGDFFLEYDTLKG